MELGRFIGLKSVNVSEDGENASAAWRFDPGLGVGE